MDWRELWQQVDLRVWVGPKTQVPGTADPPSSGITVGFGAGFGAVAAEAADQLRRRPLFVGFEIRF